MKADVFDINGKKSKEIDLPSVFVAFVREDVIWKFIESNLVQHPYAPSPVAGKQHSASGIIRHKRHAWKISYGRGMSRVPRKIHSNRGAQFNWIGAEVSGTRGGRRSHPPRVEHFITEKKINKREERLALVSALAATAQEKFVKRKYARLGDVKISLPLIIDSLDKIRTKAFLAFLRSILQNYASVAIPESNVRSGRGKMRGRKMKKSAGLLIVKGMKEDFLATGLDVKNAKSVSVKDLAKGGPGRLTLYTEQGLKELEARIK